MPSLPTPRRRGRPPRGALRYESHTSWLTSPEGRRRLVLELPELPPELVARADLLTLCLVVASLMPDEPGARHVA